MVHLKEFDTFLRKIRKAFNFPQFSLNSCIVEEGIQIVKSQKNEKTSDFEFLENYPSSMVAEIKVY